MKKYVVHGMRIIIRVLMKIKVFLVVLALVLDMTIGQKFLVEKISVLL